MIYMSFFDDESGMVTKFQVELGNRVYMLTPIDEEGAVKVVELSLNNYMAIVSDVDSLGGDLLENTVMPQDNLLNENFPDIRSILWSLRYNGLMLDNLFLGECVQENKSRKYVMTDSGKTLTYSPKNTTWNALIAMLGKDQDGSHQLLFIAEWRRF